MGRCQRGIHFLMRIRPACPTRSEHLSAAHIPIFALEPKPRKRLEPEHLPLLMNSLTAKAGPASPSPGLTAAEVATRLSQFGPKRRARGAAASSAAIPRRILDGHSVAAGGRPSRGAVRYAASAIVGLRRHYLWLAGGRLSAARARALLGAASQPRDGLVHVDGAECNRIYHAGGVPCCGHSSPIVCYRGRGRGDLILALDWFKVWLFARLQMR